MGPTLLASSFLLSLVVLVWLTRRALFVGPGSRTAKTALIGLALVLVGVALAGLYDGHIMALSERTADETTAPTEWKKGAVTTAYQTKSVCSEDRNNITSTAQELRVGTLHYSLIDADVEEAVGLPVGEGAVLKRIVVVVSNDGPTPVTIDPWFDF